MGQHFTVSEATDRDMFQFYGARLQNPWEGLVAKIGNQIVGMGGVYANEAGEVVAFLDLRKWARKPSVYKYAFRLINEMKSRGCDEVVTSCDKRIPRASEFLSRLGFKPTDREEAGRQVWVWRAEKHGEKQ